jgi:hypothetical protein
MAEPVRVNRNGKTAWDGNGESTQRHANAKCESVAQMPAITFADGSGMLDKRHMRHNVLPEFAQ